MILILLPVPARAGEGEAVGGTWELLNPPPGRSMHSAVWDPIANRMLVFGGFAGSNLGDLWSFDPVANRWEALFPEGERPARLIAHSAVWDTVHQRMLVYGGFGMGSTGGLWAYDPRANQWTAITPEGRRPDARGYHSAAWDAATGRMYVFAGIGPRVEIYDDLWVYDAAANTWAELPRPRLRPVRRFFHAAAWDPSGEQLLVFGGADLLLGEWYNDLWSYRPSTNTWTEVFPVGRPPSERLSHSMVWDPSGSRMLIFGGGCGAGCYNQDLWSFTPATRAWQQLVGAGRWPVPRGGQTGVWDAARQRLLLFGGAKTDGPTNEVWSYAPAIGTWTQMASGPTVRMPTTYGRAWGIGRPKSTGPASPLPTVRLAATGVWDATAGALLAFGGHTEDGTMLDELWSYWPRTGQWQPIITAGDGPLARSGHAVAWDAAARQLYLFGGFGLLGYSDELWRYDPEAREWALDPGADDLALASEDGELGARPLAREDHSLVWDPSGERLFLFGGTRGQGSLDDLWSYAPATGHWTALESDGPWPTRRHRHSAVWDPERGRMLLFGGYGGPEVGRYLNDLWSFDPETGAWEQLALDGPQPTPRAWHRAVWDSVRGRLLVVGGFEGGIDYLGDVWYYDPSTDQWSHLAAGEPAPTARAQHVAVWADDHLLIYGGNRTNEVWQFWPNP